MVSVMLHGIPVRVSDEEALREQQAACTASSAASSASSTASSAASSTFQHHSTTAECPAVWDVVICWPPTPAGRTVIKPCPEYIHTFDHTAEASKQCSTAGAWGPWGQWGPWGPGGGTGGGGGGGDPEANGSLTWTYTNYSQCFTDHRLDTSSPVNSSVLQMWVPVVKKVAQLGYSVSLCTLILAFVVLFSIKKLRCPRNNLHLHLFASFMLRAAMYLLKDVLFVRGVGLPGDVQVDGVGDVVEFIPGRSNWECKLIVSIWQYSIMANYSWILMEGLYLHNLIFLALFSDNSAITLYVALGWGLPASVVLPWVIGKRLLDDHFCWTMNGSDAVYYLVRIPTIITVLVSFALFVNIARVLLVKMQASIQVQRRGMRYKRWARSTMVLVPLFGTHYALFLVFSVGMGRHEVLEVVWLMLDQTFASFQGCLVALLYCLLTREVRVEVRRRWQSTRAGLWGQRNGSTRRPGSLLQSAPSLSRPAPPCAPCDPCRHHRSSDLPCQISGRLEEDVIDNGHLDSNKDKDITAASRAVTVAARTKGLGPGDAQSWV